MLIPTVARTRPVSTTLPGPILSARNPAIGMVSIAPKPCGATSQPELSGDSPRTCWKYSVNKRLAPKKAMANRVIVTTATVM